MRVLVISSVYPNATQPTFGVFVRERVRHVAQRCDITVVAPVPWFPLNRLVRGRERATVPLHETQDGITVHHPRFLSPPRYGKSLDGMLYFASILPLAARLHRAAPFDLIDAHFAYPDGVAAVLLGKVLGRPTVVTLRGDEARLADHTLRRLQVGRALRAATVIAVSDALRQVAARFDVEPSTVQVIPNAVDNTHFCRRDRAAARDALGLPKDRTVLLSVGALIERKGHHRIVDALADLVAARPDLLYIIVGGDVPGTGSSYRSTIEERMRRANLGEHVRIIPQQPHDRVPLWLAAADLFCLATRWEGWCNALMEALACGVPVITTSVGGNAEFVHHGEDGFVVPFWDAAAFRAAVLRALEIDWDRGRIAARATANSWDSVAGQVIGRFQAVLARHAGPTQLGAGTPRGADHCA